MILSAAEGTGVSVVLPTYNRRDRLPRAIRSVLEQNHKELELIVVDDGSTEDISAVVSAFNDPRLRYARSEERRGAAAARNLGVRLARYQWVAFQDSDDEWRPGKLEAQLAAASLPEKPLLICSSYLLLPRGRTPSVVGGGSWPANHWRAADCYTFPFITPTWLVWRDSLLTTGLFDESLPNLEDWELAFRLVKEGRVHVLPRPLVVKHGSADGIYHDTVSRLKALEMIYARHLETWRQDRAVMAAFLADIGRLRCHHGRLADGRAALLASLRQYPTWQALVQFLAALGGQRSYAAIRTMTQGLRELQRD